MNFFGGESLVRQLPKGIEMARGTNGQIESTSTRRAWHGARASIVHSRGTNSMKVYSLNNKGSTLRRIQNRAKSMSISVSYKRNGRDASVFVLGKSKKSSTGRSSG